MKQKQRIPGDGSKREARKLLQPSLWVAPTYTRAVCSENPWNPCNFLMFVISATSVRKCSLTLPLGRVAQALLKPVAFFGSGVGK